MLREMQIGLGNLKEWERELAGYLQYDTGEFETLVADVCDLIPSDTYLLQNLLDLSKTAIILNTARNPMNAFTGNNRSNILVQESNFLADLCER